MKVDLTTYQNRNTHKRKRLMWEIVWACLFRLTPRWRLNRWRRLLLRTFGASVGTGCRIYGGARCWQPWNLTIGDHCWIDAGVNLYSVDKITIGSNVVISADAFICTAGHDVRSESFALKTSPVVIADQAWVAARAIVLPGVAIGEGAVVAAGAIVTKDVAPWTIVAGNPARLIGRRDEMA